MVMYIDIAIGMEYFKRLVIVVTNAFSKTQNVMWFECGFEEDSVFWATVRAPCW